MLESAPDEICASPYGLGSDPVRTPSTVNALPGSRPPPIATIRLSSASKREGDSRFEKAFRRWLRRTRVESRTDARAD
jgi:hypothetical protein